MQSIHSLAPELDLQHAPPIDSNLWLNTAHPLSLEELHGRVVILLAFQVLCPGCVYHGLPQAMEIHRAFDTEEVAVIGLHSVFENHAVMTPAALRVFIHENKITFPIAIDRAGEDGEPLPATMRAYGLRGTPSLVVIDPAGRMRAQHFGRVADLIIGATIGRLLAEKSQAVASVASPFFPMTPPQIRLVQTTWEKIAPISETAATLFYTRLFELDPSLRPLFTSDLREQGAKLMTMLQMIVKGLDCPAALVEKACGLGRRHIAYGVKDEHYATVGAALLWTLEQGLGVEFTPKVSAAWSAAYGFLAETMKT